MKVGEDVQWAEAPEEVKVKKDALLEGAQELWCIVVVMRTRRRRGPLFVFAPEGGPSIGLEGNAESTESEYSEGIRPDFPSLSRCSRWLVVGGSGCCLVFG